MSPSEGYVIANKRTWYDVCVKCYRIVSPRHACCPKCGSTEYVGTIKETGERKEAE